MIDPEDDPTIPDDDMEAVIKRVGSPRAGCGGRMALNVARIRAMRTAGFSWEQIATYFEVSASTIRRRMRENP